MSQPVYPTIHGIQFTASDRDFIKDQMEKHIGFFGMFVILLYAGSKLVDMVTSSGDKDGITDASKEWAEFLLQLEGKSLNVVDQYWQDARKYVLHMALGTARQDTQQHLMGRYHAVWTTSKLLRKPSGKAVQFFRGLDKFLLDLSE